MRRPHSHSLGSSCGSNGVGLTRNGALMLGQTSSVPSWMLGTDDPSLTAAFLANATFDHSAREVNSLGSNGESYSSPAVAAAVAGSRSISATAGRGTMRVSAAAGGGTKAGSCQRPATAAARLTRSPGGKGDVLGLAEKRREFETRRSDLAAVRALD
jgi:hypothetical protein